MVLLARVADRLYWGARYIERAEDTSRIVGAYNEMIIDLPVSEASRWPPLLTIAGPDPALGASLGTDPDESAIIHHLVVDRSNPGSIVTSIEMSRGNLRASREVLPRSAWRAVNSLHQHVEATAPRAVQRQFRDEFLRRVIDDSRRLDGILESSMNRDNAYRMWRLGRLMERADMTTRVIGVAAAALLQLQQTDVADPHDGIQWMGVLRSLSARQMYQRATRGPIDGSDVTRFLLFYAPFPRSVQGCLDQIRSVLLGLPTSQEVIGVLDRTEETLSHCDPVVSDAAALDDAVDEVQLAITALHEAIMARYVPAPA